MLICPKCALPLTQEKTRAIGPKGHSFDRARQGYWNLLLDSSSKGHGDDEGMLRARRSFLERGYYEALALEIAAAVRGYSPENPVLLDAGCGEGYYTEKTVRLLNENAKRPQLYAFDISKYAVRMTAARFHGNGCFFVASSFSVTMESGGVDLILSLFSPYCEEEFLRLLKPGGYLIRAVPLADHLYSLKEAVYEKPTRNLTKATVGDRFVSVEERNVRKEMVLSSNEDIQSLFGMTPYVHKTGKEDLEKLSRLENLKTCLDVGILVTRKIQ